MHVYPTIKDISGSGQCTGLHVPYSRPHWHAPTSSCLVPVIKRCTACGAKGWVATLHSTECTGALRSWGSPGSQLTDVGSCWCENTEDSSASWAGAGSRAVKEGCSLLASPTCDRKVFIQPLAFYIPSHCML